MSALSLGSSRRRIAVVSTARSDYGIYRPLLRAIQDDSALELQLIVAASHLDVRFGNTVTEIEDDGFVPAARVVCPLYGDGPASVSRTMGQAAMGFADAYDLLKPNLIVALGDRYEMHAAVSAAVPFLIPIAHIAGGAVTRGAIDDGFRHSMSKLSHLHFPETEEQKARLLRLGEEEWRIFAVGSLSIDSALAVKRWNLGEITSRYGLQLREAPLLVTLHPETRDFSHTAEHADALLNALAAQRVPIVFTYPGADTSGRVIIDRIEAFVHQHPESAFVVPHMGTQGYFSLMAQARALVGNSSSGIIEAASFNVPVVNVGRRQDGRLAPANVIHCKSKTEQISAAISLALSPSFRDSLNGLVNPYGHGGTAAHIVDVLRAIPLDNRLLVKGSF